MPFSPDPLAHTALPADRAANLREGVQAFSREAGGVLSLEVVLMHELPHLMADAHAGDPDAGRLLMHVRSAMIQWTAAPPRWTPKCSGCCVPLRLGAYSVAIATPACTEPENLIALGICHECATDPAGVEAVAHKSLTRFWPDMRTIALTHSQGGQA